MADHLTTFRNGVLSIYQSAMEDLARQEAGKKLTPGERPGLDNHIIAAGAAVAATRMPQAAGDVPVTTEGVFQTCAELGLQYLEARARGDQEAIKRVKNQTEFSKCDEKWISTFEEYAKYFEDEGGLRPIPYIRAGTVAKKVLDMKPNARVALIADWGTGTDVAVDLLKSVKKQNPDVVIHLGDVYYSGTEEECDAYFLRIVNDVLDRKNTGIPVYTIPGNHDMYSAGSGFYPLIKQLNAGARQQLASFFCLRSTDGLWQFEAMDTGLHDHDPFHVKEVLTYLETDEEDWHVERIKEFSGQTILLSHHQLFSAFRQIGQPDKDGNLNACNPHLLASYARFQGAGRIAAWFWGHEHILCIYKRYAGLQYGRCIGHGAIPVFDSSSPYNALAGLDDPPQLIDNTQLRLDGKVYAHGYAMIKFNGPVATVDYFQGSDVKPSFTERIPGADVA
jgi:Calcineurin-like phosphoesterase